MTAELRDLLRPVPVAPLKAENGTPHEERLARRIDYLGPSACWEWRGCRLGGYGAFILADRTVQRAHRVVYELLVGPIPEGIELDHLCRIRACCNPAHLEPVAHRVNVLRGESPAARHAAKTHCPQGHPYSPENSYVYERKGHAHRMCRACTRIKNAARRRGKTR